MKYKRIAILGNAGSGKSTLADSLHKKLQIPVFHLDQYFWKPGWVHPDPDEYKTIHNTLCDQETWIMEGNNLRVAQYRFQKADCIIFLDIPRRICFYNIFKRMITWYGKTTPFSAPDCPEGIHLALFPFLWWVWNYPNKQKPKILNLLKQYPEKQIIVLRSQKEIQQCIEFL